jgi:hypothetical protein
LVGFLLLVRAVSLPADDAVPYTLVVDPPTAEVGETVRIAFVVSGISSVDISVSEPPLPRGLELIRGPYIRPLLPGEGTIIEYALRCTEAGTYSVPGFTLRAGNARTTTSGFRIVVTEGSGGSGAAGGVIPSGMPKFRWISTVSRVEVGRPVPVFLVPDRQLAEGEIRGLRYPKPDRGIVTEFPRPAESILFAAVGSGSGGDFLTGEGVPVTPDEIHAPAEGFLYTPLDAGRAVIPGGEVSLRRGEVEFPSLELDVVSLPEDAGSGGGVGDFELEAFLRTEGYGASGTATITVRISGTGNLPILRFPEVECTGARCYETEKRGDFEAALRGYTGWVEKIYRVDARPGDEPRIDLSDLLWFDPWDGRIKTAPGRVWELPEYLPREEGSPAAGEAGADSEVQGGTAIPEEAVPPESGGPSAVSRSGNVGLPASLSPRDRRIIGRRFPYEEPVAGVVFLPGAAALVIGMTAYRKRRRSGDSGRDPRRVGASRRPPKGEVPGPGGASIIPPVLLLVFLAGGVVGLIAWAGGPSRVESTLFEGRGGYSGGPGDAEEGAAEKLRFEDSRSGPTHSGDLLADVLLAEAGGDRAGAVVLLKKVLRIDPGDPRIRETADWYRREAEIGLMNPGLPFSRPDLVYLAAAVFLFTAGLSIRFDRPRAAGFAGAGGIAAAGMLFVGLFLFARPDAVLGGNARLKRIPEDESGTVAELAVGTVLKTSARTEEYTLVETESGEEGWIENKHLVEL